MKKTVQWGININCVCVCVWMNHAWVDGGRENITTIYGDQILMDRDDKTVEANNSKCDCKRTESEDPGADYWKIRLHHTVHSTVGDSNNENYFTIKFHNNQCRSWMMSHLLKLKVAVFITAYESGSQKGVMTDKRVLVEGLNLNFINVQIITGSKKVNCIYTPRNYPESSERSLPFTMRSQPSVGVSGLAEDNNLIMSVFS